jgi:branched-chain amino acid transport system substrate-binding protein
VSRKMGGSRVRALGIALLAGTVSVVVGCGSANSGGSASSGAKSGDIKVGLSGALTGGDAILGTTQRQGVQMAVNEINAAGGINGRKIKLIVEDEANDPSRMAQIAQKFVTQDHVDAIIGGTNDGTAQVLSQVAEQAKVPLVIPFANGDQITRGKKWSFQVDVASTAFVEKIVNDVAPQFSKLGIAYDDNAFGQADRNFAVADLKKMNRTPVASVSMPNEAGDYTAQLASFRRAGAQALIAPMSGTNVAQLRKNMIQTGYQPAVVGPNSLAFESMIKVGGPAVDKSVCLYDVIDEAKPQAKQFNSKFKQNYGHDATSGFELLGYDATKILEQGLKAGVSSGGVDKSKVRGGIEGLHGYTAVSGKSGSTISYSPGDHRRASPNDLVLRWVDGGQFRNAPSSCASRAK